MRAASPAPAPGKGIAGDGGVSRYGQVALNGQIPDLAAAAGFG